MTLLNDEYLIQWILFFPLITSFGFFINIVKINYTHKSNFYDTDNE
jgi:hypothetical protein